MKELSRRDFSMLVVGGAVLSLLGDCAPQESSTVSGNPRTEAAQELTTADPPRALLRNENVPGFYVRYVKPFQAPDAGRWTLSLNGLVENPQKLSLSDVLALPRISQVSRMKCVESWSAAAKWEGVHLTTFLDLAHPRTEARWLHLYCADGYHESMPMEALLEERVLFVHHMNDQILPDIYGAPLRLMVPFRYGYKSAKAIVTMEFAEEELRGFWSEAGSYPTQGNIRPGRDHPLDLEGTRRIAGGAEIFYPDGIESQDM